MGVRYAIVRDPLGNLHRVHGVCVKDATSEECAGNVEVPWMRVKPGKRGEQQMTQIQQLQPPIALRPKTPRCEAPRESRYANDKPGPLPPCHHSSSFVINGKHLCRAHAGSAALQILLDQSASQATSLHK